MAFLLWIACTRLYVVLVHLDSMLVHLHLWFWYMFSVKLFIVHMYVIGSPLSPVLFLASSTVRGEYLRHTWFFLKNILIDLQKWCLYQISGTQTVSIEYVCIYWKKKKPVPKSNMMNIMCDFVTNWFENIPVEDVLSWVLSLLCNIERGWVRGCSYYFLQRCVTPQKSQAPVFKICYGIEFWVYSYHWRSR